MPARAALALTLIAGLSAGPALAAKLYRWVDDQGNVHYGDKIPPEHVKQERQELNKQGVPVKTIERAKTPEELEADRQADEARKEEERRQREAEEHDRFLLRNYTTEADIQRARDAKIAGVDNAIQLSRGNLKNLSTQLEAQMERAAQLERSGKPVPPEYVKDISETRAQIQLTEEHIRKREGEKDLIRERYAEDQKRFRELISARAPVRR